MSKYQIPEIFIKEINLFDATAGQTTVKIKTTIKDSKGDNSWTSSGVAKHMKYLVVISSNTSLNNKMNMGKIKFDKDHMMSVYAEDESVKIFSSNIDLTNPIVDPQEDGKILFMNHYEAQFSKDVNNIKVFCAAYLETTDIFKESNLQFKGSSRRYGVVSSDTIINLGRVAYEASVFLLPNGAQYTGPVHFHKDEGYMVGPTHTSQKHDKLREIRVINFKIKDYRKKDYPFSALVKKKKVSTYSGLNFSINSAGNPTGIFSVNFKNLLLHETKYGNLMASLTDEAVIKNINSLKIKNLQIVRKRLDVDESYVLIKSFSQRAGGIIEEVNTKTASIMELTQGGNEIRTFSFTDKTLHKAKLGKYKYHLSLSFTDPTGEFVSSTINNLRTTQQDLNNYYLMFQKNKNYNFILDRTKPKFYESQINQIAGRNLNSPSWAMANEACVRVSSYLYDLSERQREELQLSISTRVDPRTATTFSLKNFIEEYNNLNNTFQRIIDLSNNNNQTDADKSFVKTANSKNVIFMDHLFNEAYMPKNYYISYDYMGMTNETGPLVLTKEAIESRMKRETDKFFTRPPSDTETQTLASKYKFLFNFEENLFSYLSPMSIEFDKDGVNLEDISKIKIQKTNQVFKPTFYRNIYNFGLMNKSDSRDISDEMNKPDIKRKKES